jgi:hypothetical protein
MGSAATLKCPENLGSNDVTPHNAQLRIIGLAREDAIIGSLVVLLLGPRNLGLDVERKRLDRAGEVVLGHLSTVLFARNPCAIDVFRYRTD